LYEIAENTLRIMLEKGIHIRDTLFPYSITDKQYVNLDNYYKNGGKYKKDDPFNVVIIWDNEIKFGGSSGAKGYKAYLVPELQSCAFDLSPILIHPRYSTNNGSHVIVHELVHKFQHVIMSEETNYINFNGKNWSKYISQRTELEAHYVQCIYILRYNQQWLKEVVSSQFPDEYIILLRKIKDLTTDPFSHDQAKKVVKSFSDLRLIGSNAVKPGHQNTNEKKKFSIVFTAVEYHKLIDSYALVRE